MFLWFSPLILLTQGPPSTPQTTIYIQVTFAILLSPAFLNISFVFLWSPVHFHRLWLHLSLYTCKSPTNERKKLFCLFESGLPYLKWNILEKVTDLLIHRLLRLPLIGDLFITGSISKTNKILGCTSTQINLKLSIIDEIRHTQRGLYMKLEDKTFTSSLQGHDWNPQHHHPTKNRYM